MPNPVCTSERRGRQRARIRSWQCVPMAVTTLEQELDELFGRPADEGISLAFLLLQGGELVAERYGVQPGNLFQPDDVEVTAETPLISWSIAKSMVHACVRHPRRRRADRSRRSCPGRRVGRAPRRRRSPRSTSWRCAAGCGSSRTTSTARRRTASTCCSAPGPPTTPPMPRRCRSTIRLARCGTTPRARRTSSVASSVTSSAAARSRCGPSSISACSDRAACSTPRRRSTPQARGSVPPTSTRRPASSLGSASCTGSTA